MTSQSPPHRLTKPGVRALALLWGLAEATLFFIIPDVLLSLVAVRRRRLALEACAWATAGAVLGGTVMYLWATVDHHAAVTALAAVPAVDREMIESVDAELAAHGAWAVFLGPIRTKPYKIYASLAADHGLRLGELLLVTIPARSLRFALVVVLVGWAMPRVLPRLDHPRRLRVITVFWIINYVLYLGLRTRI
jgi:membrane protein YqaA with SNARE-associated domain